jgi:hypothetical protein
VRERLNRAVSKTVEPSRVPWVRIPPSPPLDLFHPKDFRGAYLKCPGIPRRPGFTQQTYNCLQAHRLSGSAPSSPLRVFQRQSRAVLLAGFGGLLVMMIFAGIDGLRVLSRMQERSGAIQHDFLERSRVLNQIRSDVYLSGTFARDYLLDPQPATAEKNRTELNRLRQEMDGILVGYAGLLRPSERTPLNGLRLSLDEYWRVLDPVFQWSPEQRRQSGVRFLQDEVFPRRLTMLGLADQIQSMNERQMDAGNQQVAALFS